LGPGELDALLGVPGQAVLALTADGGSAVAVANLDPDGPGVGRCSVLVDNAWQGRGLGTALVRRMAEVAADQGLVELTGRARPDDLGVTQLLRRAGLRPTAEITDGVVHLRAPTACARERVR
jgi:GNAT superfamily N-acetyltransferase